MDYIKGRLGFYGTGKKFSHDEMTEDNKEDLKDNEYGLSCPKNVSCSDRCEKHINSSHADTKGFLINKGYLE